MGEWETFLRREFNERSEVYLKKGHLRGKS